MRDVALAAVGWLALTGSGLVLAAEPEIKVFELPDGARPHDVAPAPDGRIWYTAQRQGALGILDPETGELRQVPLGGSPRRTA